MKIIKQDLRFHIYPSKNWCIDWYKNEYLHREDGPAEVWNDGYGYYRLNGRQCLKDDYWKEVHDNY